jgi:hypothetical protein
VNGKVWEARLLSRTGRLLVIFVVAPLLGFAWYLVTDSYMDSLPDADLAEKVTAPHAGPNDAPSPLQRG